MIKKPSLSIRRKDFQNNNIDISYDIHVTQFGKTVESYIVSDVEEAFKKAGEIMKTRNKWYTFGLECCFIENKYDFEQNDEQNKTCGHIPLFLKHCNINQSNFENFCSSFNSIDDTGAQLLAENFNNQKLRGLGLSYNKIGNIGAQAIANLIKNNNVLDVGIDNNEITDIGAMTLADALLLANKNLRDLSCAYNPIDITGENLLCEAYLLTNAQHISCPWWLIKNIDGLLDGLLKKDFNRVSDKIHKLNFCDDELDCSVAKLVLKIDNKLHRRKMILLSSMNICPDLLRLIKTYCD